MRLCNVIHPETRAAKQNQHGRWEKSQWQCFMAGNTDIIQVYLINLNCGLLCVICRKEDVLNFKNIETINTLLYL